MAYWLLKSEPETWSWLDQQQRGVKGEMWDGVRNHQAANHLRAMQVGDLAFFYHSGKERAVVGIVEVARAAYPDPTDDTDKFVAVTVKAREALPQPVTLSHIKQQKALQAMPLVRQPRLSVMPVSDQEWQTILKLAAGH